MPNVIVHYRRFEPIIEAFTNIGHNVISLDEAHTLSSFDDTSLYLVDMYDEIKSPVSSLAFKHRLARAGVPTITWNRDAPANKGEKVWRMWLLQHLRYFDIYASHSLQGADAFPATPLYLPNAAWTTHYNLGRHTLAELRSQDVYQYDVSFFGRIDSRRYPEMEARDAFFSALRDKLDALGISHQFTDAPMNFEAQRDFIQRSRINVNFHAGCDSCYNSSQAIHERSWGLPERCYGVPACGGFLLSDARQHAHDDFRPNTEWVDFSGVEDCIEKIRFHLQHFEHTRAIAEAQYHRVMKDHTYARRAEQLVEAAQAWKSSQAN